MLRPLNELLLYAEYIKNIKVNIIAIKLRKVTKEKYWFIVHFRFSTCA
jgi:hypothetical protein